MNLQKLSEPLSIDQIDFRIQSINKGGYATILAYKDARVDMQRLDDAVGPLNWKREHNNDNHNCVVSIYNKEIGEWVSKEDTGTESNTEAEKGLASDSFKRACFNWGIGRELYEYPVISVKLNADEFEIKEFNGKQKVQQTYNLKLKEWIWVSEFTDNGKIFFLAAIDEKGRKRFEWRMGAQAKQSDTAKPHPNSVQAKEAKEKARESDPLVKVLIGYLASEEYYDFAREALEEITDEQEKIRIWNLFNTREKEIVRSFSKKD